MWAKVGGQIRGGHDNGGRFREEKGAIKAYLAEAYFLLRPRDTL